MKLHMDIQGPQRMETTDFGETLTLQCYHEVDICDSDKNVLTTIQ